MHRRRCTACRRTSRRTRWTSPSTNGSPVTPLYKQILNTLSPIGIVARRCMACRRTSRRTCWTSPSTNGSPVTPLYKHSGSTYSPAVPRRYKPWCGALPRVKPRLTTGIQPQKVSELTPKRESPSSRGHFWGSSPRRIVARRCTVCRRTSRRTCWASPSRRRRRCSGASAARRGST